jgi:uncharacterized membrane protein
LPKRANHSVGLKQHPLEHHAWPKPAHEVFNKIKIIAILRFGIGVVISRFNDRLISVAGFAIIAISPPS